MPGIIQTDSKRQRTLDYKCNCNGVVAPNGICGYIVCSSDDCGAPNNFDCEHKVKQDDSNEE